MRVVVREGEALEMVVQLQPQVVGNALSHALGVVVVNVERHAPDRGGQHHGDRCSRRERWPIRRDRRTEQSNQPRGNRIALHHVVDHNLQRPRRCEAGGRFDKHREQNYRELPLVRPRETDNELSRS